jgi:hypothetical protein
MENEKLQILKMVESGKISSPEAVRLLEALESHSPHELEKVNAGPSKKKYLKIRVFDSEGGKSKVNVSLPLGLVRMISKIIPHSAKMELDNKNIDLEEILSAVENVEDGKILEVQDDEDNERVEIVIE